ncbi:Rab5 GDP/GTP exchange factor [Sarcoptes scabiei]|uniref:Rab5 GDP/GTP exchange factor n=1 Tax=Sarcoptes scabiei TaxID=52283 RepID=A0A834VBF6_SARSC|nr:Rab5 GDP/GTP exchange factor [Sarcoptes scabiei]
MNKQLNQRDDLDYDFILIDDDGDDDEIVNENNIINKSDNNDKIIDKNQQSHRIHIVPDQSALHCKNGCGFFGNREWDGFCSICYKEIHHSNQQKPHMNHHTPQSSDVESSNTNSSFSTPPLLSPLPFSKSIKQKLFSFDTLNRAHSITSLTPNSSIISNPTGSLSFRKFEEKKRQQSDKKSIKSIFRRASTFREYRSLSSISNSNQNPHNNESRSKVTNHNRNTNSSSLSFFSLEKPLAFGEEVLAKIFPDHALKDIDYNVTKCAEKINKLLNRGCSIDDLTDLLHDFYSQMENHFQTNSHYKDVTNAQFNNLIDQTEKILMGKLYQNLFNRVQNEEEERDLELQRKIRNLNWIMSTHLDVDINLRNPKVKDLMDQAITEIIEVDSKHVPYEKLESIVRCSKTIFEMLQINNNDAISADQFLPALVFVIIQANPPLLQSNIKFISRFSIPSRLMTGEAGYYFTNLCCATTFIEKISGEALNMSETDFQSYVSGEAQPPGYYQQSFLCEPFRIMDSNQIMLNDTNKRNAHWQESLKSFERKLDRFEETIESKCKAAIDSSKETLNQCSKYCFFKRDNKDEINDDIDLRFLPNFLKNLILPTKSNHTTGRLNVLDDQNIKNESSDESESKKSNSVINQSGYLVNIQSSNLNPGDDDQKSSITTLNESDQ